MSTEIEAEWLTRPRIGIGGYLFGILFRHRKRSAREDRYVSEDCYVGKGRLILLAMTRGIFLFNSAGELTETAAEVGLSATLVHHPALLVAGGSKPKNAATLRGLRESPRRWGAQAASFWKTRSDLAIELRLRVC